MAPGVCHRHVLLLTCLMILSGSGALGQDWVRGPGSGVPDGWKTTSEVARKCQLLPDTSHDPPAACKEPMSIEEMSDKKKSASMCMIPFSGGPTVEYEKGTTNVEEWAIIKVSGCPSEKYYSNLASAESSCESANVSKVANGNYSRDCVPNELQKSACSIHYGPTTGLKDMAGTTGFDPKMRDLVFRIPVKPDSDTNVGSPGAVYRPPMMGEGMIGVAVNGVPIIPIPYEKGSYMEPSPSMAFDDCGGRTTSSGKYHYTLPPTCLLKRLGGFAPSDPNWWLADDPSTHWDQAVPASQSPLIGWAIDGFPIYGPYDPITGELQIAPADQGCESQLDQCNGKRMPNGAGYAYFLTPNPPYGPKCLVGSTRGSALDSGMGPGSSCPPGGMFPPSGGTGLQCSPALQQILVHRIPPGRGLDVACYILGSIFAATALISLLNLSANRGEVGSCILITFLFLFCAFRAIWLLVDPYQARGHFSLMDSGIIFGISFPFMIACGLQVTSIAQNKCEDVSKPTSSAPIAIGYFLAFGHLFTQILMDSLRGKGSHMEWHVADQWMFFGLGLIVFSAAIITILSSVGPKIHWLPGPFFGLMCCILTVVNLTADMGAGNSHRYFAWTISLRAIECASAVGFLAVVLDKRSVDAGKPESDEQSKMVPVFVPSPAHGAEIDQLFATASIAASPPPASILPLTAPPPVHFIDPTRMEPATSFLMAQATTFAQRLQSPAAGPVQAPYSPMVGSYPPMGYGGSNTPMIQPSPMIKSQQGSEYPPMVQSSPMLQSQRGFEQQTMVQSPMIQSQPQLEWGVAQVPPASLLRSPPMSPDVKPYTPVVGITGGGAGGGAGVDGVNYGDQLIDGVNGVSL